MFSFCLRQPFVVDIVGVLVVGGRVWPGENLLIIVTLDSSIPARFVVVVFFFYIFFYINYLSGKVSKGGEVNQKRRRNTESERRDGGGSQLKGVVLIQQVYENQAATGLEYRVRERRGRQRP